jgi:hypothetical protein
VDEAQAQLQRLPAESAREERSKIEVLTLLALLVQKFKY